MTTSAMCHFGYQNFIDVYLKNALKCVHDKRTYDFAGRALVSGIYDYLSKNYSPWHLV